MHLSISNFRFTKTNRIPIAFIITLCVAGIVELSAHAYLSRFHDRVVEKTDFYTLSGQPTVEESIVQWQIRNIVRDNKPFDVLLLGCSSCLMGVDPLIIREKTGLSCWNAGTLGWLGIEGHLKILELFIKHHGIPKIVIYHSSLFPFAQTDKQIDEFGYYRRLTAWLEPEGHQIPLPSIGLRGLARGFMVPGAVKMRFLNEKRGIFPSDIDIGELLAKRMGTMTELNRQNLDLPNPVTVNLTVDASRAAELLFSAAEKYNFKLLLILSPLPEMVHTAEYVDELNRLESQLRRISLKYKRGLLFSPFVRFFPNEYYATFNHLDEQGAKQNSIEISVAVLSLVNGER